MPQKRVNQPSRNFEEFQTSTFSEKSPDSKNLLPKKLAVGLVIVIILVGLGYLFKDKFLVATVNGRPIFRYELNQRLTSSFGKETLENIIVEKLIKEEAKNKGVVVSEEELDKELEKLERSLGEGVKLEDTLKFQGISLAEFRGQLRLRLQVNKILEKDISISQDEVEKYLKDNAKTLVATDEGGRKAEAQERLKEQKISEKIQDWVSGLLAEAKIVRYLK